MKNLFAFLFLAFFTSSCFCQNMGIGTTAPKNKLHVAGGLRVDTLANGTDSGLLRHDKNGVVYRLSFSGNPTDVLRGNATFGPAGAATPAWNLTGNSGINPGKNFLGTTDNQPLRLRVNNIWAGELNPGTGNVFLGLRSGQANTTH